MFVIYFADDRLLNEIIIETIVQNNNLIVSNYFIRIGNVYS